MATLGTTIILSAAVMLASMIYSRNMPRNKTPQENNDGQKGVKENRR